jgi:hypothetical protein
MFETVLWSLGPGLAGNLFLCRNFVRGRLGAGSPWSGGGRFEEGSARDIGPDSTTEWFLRRNEFSRRAGCLGSRGRRRWFGLGQAQALGCRLYQLHFGHPGFDRPWIFAPFDDFNLFFFAGGYDEFSSALNTAIFHADVLLRRFDHRRTNWAGDPHVFLLFSRRGTSADQGCSPIRRLQEVLRRVVEVEDEIDSFIGGRAPGVGAGRRCGGLAGEQFAGGPGLPEAGREIPLHGAATFA